MTECAFWRRLDRPGHDAARLRWTASGWRLEGAAVFMHDNGPASLIYTVDMDTGWKTLRAHVRGFLASDSVNQLIRRTSEGWFLNGSKAEGLNHLVDVDFGFTPATNLQQLRRVDLSPGKATELPVAWLDAGASTLIELPQHYERLDERTYRYRARSVGYEATLTIASNGFVALYPDLWEMTRL